MLENLKLQENHNGGLSEEIASVVSAKIKRSVKKFLKVSDYVSTSSTNSLAQFDHDELVLGSLLGSGGFSHVIEVKALSPSGRKGFSEEDVELRSKIVETSRDKNRGRSPFVIKHIKEKFVDSPSKFKSAGTDLAIEAHFLASLNHKHILGIVGWTSGGLESVYEDGRNDAFFLLMERLEESLESRIKMWARQMRRYKAPFLQKINSNMQEVMFAGRLKVGRDVASALTYLHSKGIIYRDLKPGNIGFGLDGEVKIFDFGLSREMPRGSDMNEVYQMSGKIGTQRYMAPEVCKHEPYNQKADVYSLSLVMWEMLSLVKPFKSHSKSMHKTLVIHGGERPELDPSWPCGVQALLANSWSNDIDARPTMKDFYEYLELEICDLKKTRAGPKKSWRTKVSRVTRDAHLAGSQRTIDTAEDMSFVTGQSGDSIGVLQE
mmetsp:Transcript_31613/g.44888  ORF Transcript_31613/g.44888 Transcript_31613/m.44888 type:complete len:434 (-) Transcript_31613:147-1448(-)